MNILVIGSGGREHSIIQKLADSSKINTIFAAPGNAGIAENATCIDIDEINSEALIEFAKNESVGLTIVGPEAPLNAGIADKFESAGLDVFAPTQRAAIIEGSKDFAKKLMKQYRIPTASSETFTDAALAKAYITKVGAPIVVKADGLAAGKGVVVAMTTEDALAAVEDMLITNTFNEAGSKVVIEEYLEGRELSLMAIVKGKSVYPLLTARDHKRAFDNDEGPNTGGMGAYAPVTDIAEKDLQFAITEIVQKVAIGMVQEGRSFTGILYTGLILTKQGPKVIEFNARFGDPETQVVLPLLENDLVQVLEDVLDNKDPQLKFEDAHCLGVVIASAGYPGVYKKGASIPSITLDKNQFVIHAGTKDTMNDVVSDGGRVLLIGTKATSKEKARTRTYKACDVFSDNNQFFYRKDIGEKSFE